MTEFEKSWSIYTWKGLAQAIFESNLFLYKYSNFSQIQSYFIPTCLWSWNTQCSETSAYKVLTPGNYSEEITQHSEHSESLKSRIQYAFLFSPYMSNAMPNYLLKWITLIISGAVSSWLESFLYMHVNTEWIKFCEKSSWEHVDIIMTEHFRVSSWYNLLQSHHLVSLIHSLKNDRCNDNSGDDDNDDNFVVFYLNFHPVS